MTRSTTARITRRMAGATAALGTLALLACGSPEEQLSAAYDDVTKALAAGHGDCSSVAGAIARVPGLSEAHTVSNHITAIDKKYPGAPDGLPIELARSLERLGEAYENSPCGRDDRVLAAMGYIITRPPGHWSRFDQAHLARLIHAE